MTHSSVHPGPTDSSDKSDILLSTAARVNWAKEGT